MPIKLSDEAINTLEKSEHILTTISIRSEKQTQQAFADFIECILKNNRKNNLRITIVLTGYLYAKCYASLEKGEKLSPKEILEQADKLDNQWLTANAKTIEFLKQTLGSNAVQILHCKQFFDLIKKQYPTWQQQVKTYINHKKCKRTRDQLIEIFSHKIAEEFYSNHSYEQTVAIKAAVEKFLKKETILSAFYRKLASAPLTDANYTFDAEFYPGNYNSLFKRVFLTSSLDVRSKIIPWLSYCVENPTKENNHNYPSRSTSRQMLEKSCYKSAFPTNFTNQKFTLFTPSAATSTANTYLEGNKKPSFNLTTETLHEPPNYSVIELETIKASLYNKQTTADPWLQKTYKTTEDADNRVEQNLNLANY